MIRTRSSARTLARKLCEQFYKEHKEVIDRNRPEGTITLILAKELHELRQHYLSQVFPELTIDLTANFLNQSIIKFILRRE